MIIVNIKGGLGNQMFMYAFARAVSLKNNTNFKLDINTFNWYETRRYLLNKFKIIENIANADELHIYKNKKLIQEKHFYFDPILTTIKDGYFSGYFQSYKYFEFFRGEILNDFILKDGFVDLDTNIFKKINNTNSIALGIRRGDYTAGCFNTHGLLDLSYYYESIKYISNFVKNPEFFVFTDDVEWVKENLHTNFPVHFVSNGKEHGSDGNVVDPYDYEDIITMSFCKHFIISNSTFHWWGAWLCKNKDKIVITPKIWFKNQKLQNESFDLILKDWVTI